MSIYFGGGSYYIDYDQKVELIDFINDIEDLVGYQIEVHGHTCLLYTSPSPRDRTRSRMPSSA